MASSLSNLVNSFLEEIDKINSKYVQDNRKCETWRIKYKHCNYFLEYTTFKDDLLDTQFMLWQKLLTKVWWKVKGRTFQRYTNADLKICQYLCLHVKIIYWRFHIKVPLTFWDMRKWVMWKVCLQTFSNNRTC